MYLRIGETLDSGALVAGPAVRALEIAHLPGGAFLIAGTGHSGGLAAYALTPDRPALQLDALHFPDHLAGSAGAPVAMATPAGTPALIVGADGAGGLIGYGMGDDGSFGAALRAGSAPPGATRIAAALETRLEGGRMLYAADADTGSITAGDAPAGAELEGIVALGRADVDGTPFLLAAAGGIDGVASFRIAPGDGTLAPAASMGAANGLGVAAPTAMAVVAAHGATWVVLAAAGSSSLSVMRLGAEGTLEATEHVIDSHATQLHGVQAMTAVTAGDHVFVLAGGAEGGLSLFTLLPDGRLVHLDSHAPGTGLTGGNITALAAEVLGDTIAVFAGAETGAWLTQLSVPLAGLGAVITADPGGGAHVAGTAGHDILVARGAGDVLAGGAGDDILVAGPGLTGMRGGAGADIFVMRAGAGTVRIADFDPVRDRLDLSDWPMLRHPDQLEIAPTADGALLLYRGMRVEITAHDGAPLTRSDLVGAAFDTPDRALIGVRAGTLGPVPEEEVPEEEEEEAPAPGGGDPGADPEDPPPVEGGIDIPDGVTPVVVSGRVAARTGEPPGEVLMAFATHDGSAGTTLHVNGSGEFRLDLPPGVGGVLDAQRAWTAGDPAITAADALEVLRLAVGLAPSWGPAAGADFVAADLDGDGRVGAADALEALRAAVGLDAAHPPRWVFLDAAADLSGAGRDSVPAAESIDIPGLSGDLDLALTAVLLGNMAPDI